LRAFFFRKFFSAFFAAAGKNKLDFDKTQTGVVAEMLHILLHKSPIPIFRMAQNRDDNFMLVAW